MKSARDQAIAEMDSTILLFTQSPSLTSMQHDDRLHAKSCKDANVYNESTLKALFGETVDSSIWQRHK